MTTFHFLLTLSFGVCVLGWLGVSASVAGGRAVHHLRVRRLEIARRCRPGRSP
ncbi:hypothetical protein BH18ACT13_BH18ACT13_20620 [soil metagenome]